MQFTNTKSQLVKGRLTPHLMVIIAVQSCAVAVNNSARCPPYETMLRTSQMFGQ